jgi:hypothetical protein
MWNRRAGTATLGERGRYRLLQVIGDDAIGTVWARPGHGRESRPVTIRLLRDELSANAMFLHPLRAELRNVWPRFKHPNVCSVITYREFGGRGFVRMQAVDGRTLARRLQDGPLDALETARIAERVRGAVAAAHPRHRSRWPEAAQGAHQRGWQVNVIDFGIPSALWQATRDAPRRTLEEARDRLGELADRNPQPDDNLRCVEHLTEIMRSGRAAEDGPVAAMVYVLLAAPPQPDRPGPQMTPVVPARG